MIDFPIDFVLPYVDCSSPAWQERYKTFCIENGYKEKALMFNTERFRDWGVFKYIFRGIERNLPFVNNIFLLLEDEDQIPDWLDTTNIKIVYHREFIPEQYLPTYNSTTIEMFLDRIPGLSEHFIYSNDDVYAVNPMTAEDFFAEDGSIRMNFRQRTLGKNILQFDAVCNEEFKMVQMKMIYRDTTPVYLTPYHEFAPMLKSGVTATYQMFKDKIESGITPFRDIKNHNQYIYSYYQFFRNNVSSSKRKYIYLDMKDNTEGVKQVLQEKQADVFTLNDSEATDVKKWSQARETWAAFEQCWPGISKYEKRPRVSVCVPMYNSEEYIERCLKSIPLRKDVEVIVLDDASADKSLERANLALSTYPAYMILGMRKNSGVATARNILIDHSTGEYIFFLDSDDWLLTEEFEYVLDNVLKDQDILTTKYIRNDGFSGYPTILRGAFLKRTYIGGVRHDPRIRCFEDVEFKKRLKTEKGGSLNEEQVDKVVYHYNLPRVNSITWEHYKNLGTPGYQRGEKMWEEWYENKPR